MHKASSLIQRGPEALSPRRPPLELASQIKLRRGRIHEIMGPAADMFAVLAAAKLGATCIWIGLRRDTETLCPAGLAPFIDPASLIVTACVSRGELLWAAEQALRADGAFGVILDMPDALSLRESRRLQLAAEIGGGIGLICLRGPARSSAAQTRWQCAPIYADTSSWVWQCLKGKSGKTGRWTARHTGGGYAENTLHLAPALAA